MSSYRHYKAAVLIPTGLSPRVFFELYAFHMPLLLPTDDMLYRITKTRPLGPESYGVHWLTGPWWETKDGPLSSEKISLDAMVAWWAKIAIWNNVPGTERWASMAELVFLLNWRSEEYWRDRSESYGLGVFVLRRFTAGNVRSESIWMLSLFSPRLAVCVWGIFNGRGLTGLIVIGEFLC